MILLYFRGGDGGGSDGDGGGGDGDGGGGGGRDTYQSVSLQRFSARMVVMMVVLHIRLSFSKNSWLRW